MDCGIYPYSVGRTPPLFITGLGESRCASRFVIRPSPPEKRNQDPEDGAETGGLDQGVPLPVPLLRVASWFDDGAATKPGTYQEGSSAVWVRYGVNSWDRGPP